jgi:hypothetical protein
MRISPGWSSLLLGLFAALIAAGMIGRSGFVGISWLGILAMVLGIRALRLRASGQTRTRIPAVVGMVAGGLATLVMVGSVATYALHPGDATRAGYDSMGTTRSAPLDAEPRSQIPDDSLDQYVAAAVRSTTAASAGCGVLSVQPEAVPFDGQARTPRRLRQDYLSLQLSEIIAPIRNEVKTSRAWPRGLDLDPETRTVFLPAPSCTPLGVIPKGVELRFGSTSDHGQIAIAVWDRTQQVGSLWRSVDDTVYQL